jgi:hypothetical protein
MSDPPQPGLEAIIPMVKKLLTILIGLGLLPYALAASGCGSSDPAAASLTKKQFVLKAEAICRSAEKKQLEMGSRYFQEHPNAEEEDAVVAAALPPIEEELERLRSLGVPAGDEAEVGAFFRALEESIEGARGNPKSAVLAKGNVFEMPDRLGKKYGLEVCANNP